MIAACCCRPTRAVAPETAACVCREGAGILREKRQRRRASRREAVPHTPARAKETALAPGIMPGLGRSECRHPVSRASTRPQTFVVSRRAEADGPKMGRDRCRLCSVVVNVEAAARSAGSYAVTRNPLIVAYFISWG